VLLVILLIAVAAIAAIVLSSSSSRTPHLVNVVYSDIHKSAEALKALVSENTQ
jgi:hypothetical protein